MRSFELVLLALLALRLAAVLARGASGAALRGLATVAVGAALVAHVALEGTRWPLAPAYALAVLVVAVLPFERPHREAPRLRMGRNRRKRDPLPWGRALAGSFVLVLAALLGWALPVPRLPAPTGAWAVGSVAFPLELVDAQGAAVGAGGTTMVRLWYPSPRDDGATLTAAGVAPAAASAAAPSGTAAPWIERADRLLPAMAVSGGVPAWAFDHLDLVRSWSTWGAPLAPPPDGAGWPVVTFDHGLGGFRSQNTFLAEELASHGAVVVAVEHPGGSLLTVLPDGTERPFEPLPRAEAPDYGAAVAALGARWTAETLAALDVLRRVRPDGPLGAFAGALDVGRGVAAGHSTGGAVAVDVCHAWDGCVAALALDGWWLPIDAARRTAGPEKPLVSVASDPTVGYFAPANRERFEAFAARGSASVVDLVLDASGHHDLNDTALLSPIADRFGHSTGPVPAPQAFAALRALALATVEATASAPAGAEAADDATSALVATAALRAAADHPVLVPGDAAFAASAHAEQP